MWEPKTVKNRMHLDIETPDVAAEAARLDALGARRVQMWDDIGGMERFDRRRGWWADTRPAFEAAVGGAER